MKKGIGITIAILLSFIVVVMIGVIIIINELHSYNRMLIKYKTDRNYGTWLAKYQKRSVSFIGPILDGTCFVRIAWYRSVLDNTGSFSVRIPGNEDILKIKPIFYIDSYMLSGINNVPANKYILDYGELWVVNIYGIYSLVQVLSCDSVGDISFAMPDRSNSFGSFGVVWFVIKPNPNYAATK